MNFPSVRVFYEHDEWEDMGKPARATSGHVKHTVNASAHRSLLHKNGAHYPSDSFELPATEATFLVDHCRPS
jgi:hypothetical protein